MKNRIKPVMAIFSIALLATSAIPIPSQAEAGKYTVKISPDTGEEAKPGKLEVKTPGKIYQPAEPPTPERPPKSLDEQFKEAEKTLNLWTMGKGGQRNGAVILSDGDYLVDQTIEPEARIQWHGESKHVRDAGARILASDEFQRRLNQRHRDWIDAGNEPALYRPVYEPIYRLEMGNGYRYNGNFSQGISNLYIDCRGIAEGPIWGGAQMSVAENIHVRWAQGYGFTLGLSSTRCEIRQIFIRSSQNGILLDMPEVVSVIGASFVSGVRTKGMFGDYQPMETAVTIRNGRSVRLMDLGMENCKQAIKIIDGCSNLIGENIGIALTNNAPGEPVFDLRGASAVRITGSIRKSPIKGGDQARIVYLDRDGEVKDLLTNGGRADREWASPFKIEWGWGPPEDDAETLTTNTSEEVEEDPEP